MAYFPINLILVVKKKSLKCCLIGLQKMSTASAWLPSCVLDATKQKSTPLSPLESSQSRYSSNKQANNGKCSVVINAVVLTKSKTKMQSNLPKKRIQEVP